MTPKEAIERLKHWPEMTELEKLYWLRVALGIKESMIVRLYEEILSQASGNLTPADGKLWDCLLYTSPSPRDS